MQLLLPFLIKIIGALPLSLRVFLGRCLGALFSLIPTKDSRIASSQLQLFLPGSTSIASVYAHFGQIVAECLNLKPLIQKLDNYVECEDLDKLKLLAQANIPIVALTAHTGNWDLMAAFLIKNGIKLSTAAKRARQGAFAEAITKIREEYGIKTIWRGDQSSSAEIIADLNAYRVVAALIDQDTAVSSVTLPFFGKPAKTPSGMVAIGKRVNAKFISTFIFRTSPLRYKLFIEELDSSRDIEGILTEFNQRLESYVRKYPEQWVWFHKRWRSLPDGVRLSSTEYLKHLQGLLANSVKILLLSTTLMFCSCRAVVGSKFFRFGGTNYLEQAETLSREKDYDNAIIAYQKHIESRLNVKNRPDWENPYFYYLLIGDIELGQDQPEKALSNYLIGEEKGVHETLISDRIRSLSTWYIEHGRPEEAFNLLNKYRLRDPLLFDSMLDRVSKELVKKEDSNDQTIP